MLSLNIIFAIIIVHWIADFIFQDEKWALGKSKNWNDLLNHTVTYSIVWLGFFMLYTFPLFSWNISVPTKDYTIYTIKLVFIFPLITFVFHTITDYFTSRIVSKKFAKQEYGSPIPNFGAFTVIGFDQILHYVQLFLTFYLITK